MCFEQALHVTLLQAEFPKKGGGDKTKPVYTILNFDFESSGKYRRFTDEGSQDK